MARLSEREEWLARELIRTARMCSDTCESRARFEGDAMASQLSDVLDVLVEFLDELVGRE